MLLESLVQLRIFKVPRDSLEAVNPWNNQSQSPLMQAHMADTAHTVLLRDKHLQLLRCDSYNRNKILASIPIVNFKFANVFLVQTGH